LAASEKPTICVEGFTASTTSTSTRTSTTTKQTKTKHQSQEPRSKTTDAKGLKTAYASESGFYRDPDKTLHMAGTRGSFVGEDWMENYKVYGPSLFNTLKDYYGLLEFR
jgi:hypothetical protein